MCMIHAMLDDNRDMNPENPTIVKMKLNTASPEEYSGSSDLEVYVTHPGRCQREGMKL